MIGGVATQAEKGKAFRALHERHAAFIIPNPWDIGSAHVLAHLGFEALATTSMGYAFSIGKRDTAVGRDVMLEPIAAIAKAILRPTPQVRATSTKRFRSSQEML